MMNNLVPKPKPIPKYIKVALRELKQMYEHGHISRSSLQMGLYDAMNRCNISQEGQDHYIRELILWCDATDQKQQSFHNTHR